MRIVAVCLQLNLLISSVLASLNDHRIRMEFIRSMDEATANKKGLLGDFKKRLIDMARPVPQQVRALEDNVDDDAAAADDDANAAAADDDDNAAAADDDANADADVAAGGEDANVDDDNANANGDDAYTHMDLSSYSLKYVGCEAINTWSDNLAKDEHASTVLALKRFVIFRMCPPDTCSKNRKFGCTSNYGEYMIDMESYLALVKQYHYARFDEYCTTCTTCFGSKNSKVAYQASNNNVRRLADDYYAADDDAAGDDGANAGDDAYNDDGAGGDDANADDGANNDDGVANDDANAGDDANQNNVDDANAGDDAYQNDDANAGDDDGAANAGDDGNQYAYGDDAWSYSFYSGNNGMNCDQDACKNYKDICTKNHFYNGDDYENFLECTNYFDENGVNLYVGPHCGSDEHGITIGIFEDEYCTSYLGDVGSYMKLDGFAIYQSSLDFYTSKSCISCSNEKAMWNLGNEGGDGTYELCDVLYDESAKCNQKLASDSGYESENQAENEDTVCGLIGSLIVGNFKENGEVNLANKYFDKSKWRDHSQYGKIMTVGQAIGLVISASLFLGLLWYVTKLQRALHVREAWRKPVLNKFSSAYLAGKISRNNSGIMGARSNADDLSTITFEGVHA